MLESSYDDTVEQHSWVNQLVQMWDDRMLVTLPPHLPKHLPESVINAPEKSGNIFSQINDKFPLPFLITKQYVILSDGERKKDQKDGSK
jgi:hypothetical protein